jgi:HSP20 family protein
MSKTATQSSAAKSQESEPPEQEGTAGRSLEHRDWLPFESLRRDIERAFENFHRGPWRIPFTRSDFDISRVWPGELIWGTPPVADIVEKESEYLITAEMPGVPASDVSVSLSDSHLSIKGEKKEEKGEQRKGIYLAERRYGSFHRTFRVPEGVDTDKIEASFSNGVLTVKLPKTAEAQKKQTKIEVKAA